MKNKSSPGVTLIELLLVSLVLLIVAGVSVANFKTAVFRWRNEAVVHAFLSLAQETRERAIVQGVPWEMELGSSEEESWVSARPQNGVRSEEGGKKIKFKNARIFLRSRTPLVFYNNGTASAGEIVLKFEDAPAKILRLVPLVGRFKEIPSDGLFSLPPSTR